MVALPGEWEIWRQQTPELDALQRIAPNAYAATAVNLMEKHIVTALVVTHPDHVPIGLIRWIDLSLAGVV